MTPDVVQDTIENVDVTAKLTEGRVTMCAQVCEELSLKVPEQQPLSAREPHLTLRAAGDGVDVVVDLDGDALDALAETVETLRERDG